MDKDIMQSMLEQLRTAVKQRWGALTDKDLNMIDGKLSYLPALLQARYGYTKEHARKEIDLFLKNINPESMNPLEVVRETLSESTQGEEAHVRKNAVQE